MRHVAWILTSSLALGLGACAGDDTTAADSDSATSTSGEEVGCPEGTLDCPCFENNTCFDSLECVAGSCSDPNGDGDPTGDGDGDPTGDGDGDPTGDGDGDPTGDGDGDGDADPCSEANPFGSCPDGESCNGGVCAEQPTPASCNDGIENSLETGIDCGGLQCPACGLGFGCEVDTDCATLSCEAGSCTDGTPSYTLDEDFETGDYSLFPYDLVTDVANLWEIETDAAECHAGSYCARTSPYQDLLETSKISLPLSVREDSEVSFWVKTDTEPDNHYFRFYVDGVLESEVSGQNDWQQISVPVSATGPGGPDRVLEWEYYRSDFVDLEHAPWTTVWVDDIDMPPWNSQPTVPINLLPQNGAVIDAAAPTFYWKSYDYDFDTITYEMQYDVDPSFSMPVTTGETFDFSAPVADALVDGATYFWRVRAKDDSDYRWSDWSATSSFRVDESAEYPVRWEQGTGAEFDLDSHSGTAVIGDAVRVSGAPHVVSGVTTTNSYASNKITFSNLPEANAALGGSIKVTGTARVYDNNNCYGNGTVYVNIYTDNVTQGYYSVGMAECQCTSAGGTKNVVDIAQYINDDGAIEIDLRTKPYSNIVGVTWDYFCTPYPNVELTYSTVSSGDVTSVPIYLDAFDGAPNWEKVFVDASPGTTFQVLDGDQNVIPNAVIPGNEAGLAPGTQILWHLDAQAYPVIHLRAHLDGNQQLDSWQVYANDGYKWHFGNDDELEGWTVADTGDNPVATVVDGTLYIASAVGGSDLRMVYTMPSDVDANLFTELVVRLRSSNNSQDDVTMLQWENNFGLFDPVRSFVETTFLFGFTDVTFDLTQDVIAPQQPWQGNIKALRIDPVEDYFDAGMQLSSGWVEIDSIWLR